MSNRCTACGNDLTFWDRMCGRFDHPECWDRCIVKPVSKNSQPKVRSLNPTLLFKLAQVFFRTFRFSR